MWYNYVVLSITLLAAGLQIWGAHLTDKPYKYLKYGCAATCLIASGIIILMEIVEESEFGYAMALVVVLLSIVTGAVIRIIMLLRGDEECPYREY